MNQIRMFRAACIGVCALAAAVGCTSVKNDEDYVPSRAGAVQPDSTGAQLSESVACERLTKAESKARSGLGCKAASHSCPAYIRPAGGANCFSYDQGTIDACAKLYETLTSCDAFEQHPCLVTASASCGVGQGGEGGVSGVPPLPADIGAGGDVGAGGMDESAGAGG